LLLLDRVLQGFQLFLLSCEKSAQLSDFFIRRLGSSSACSSGGRRRRRSGYILRGAEKTGSRNYCGQQDARLTPERFTEFHSILPHEISLKNRGWNTVRDPGAKTHRSGQSTGAILNFREHIYQLDE
jgi:hypothetical protein